MNKQNLFDLSLIDLSFSGYAVNERMHLFKIDEPGEPRTAARGIFSNRRLFLYTWAQLRQCLRESKEFDAYVKEMSGSTNSTTDDSAAKESGYVIAKVYDDGRMVLSPFQVIYKTADEARAQIVNLINATSPGCKFAFLKVEGVATRAGIVWS